MPSYNLANNTPQTASDPFGSLYDTGGPAGNYSDLDDADFLLEPTGAVTSLTMSLPSFLLSPSDSPYNVGNGGEILDSLYITPSYENFVTGNFFQVYVDSADNLAVNVWTDEAIVENISSALNPSIHEDWTQPTWGFIDGTSSGTFQSGNLAYISFLAESGFPDAGFQLDWTSSLPEAEEAAAGNVVTTSVAFTADHAINSFKNASEQYNRVGLDQVPFRMGILGPANLRLRNSAYSCSLGGTKSREVGKGSS